VAPCKQQVASKRSELEKSRSRTTARAGKRQGAGTGVRSKSLNQVAQSRAPARSGWADNLVQKLQVAGVWCVTAVIESIEGGETYRP